MIAFVSPFILPTVVLYSDTTSTKQVERRTRAAAVKLLGLLATESRRHRDDDGGWISTADRPRSRALTATQAFSGDLPPPKPGFVAFPAILKSVTVTEARLVVRTCLLHSLSLSNQSSVKLLGWGSAYRAEALPRFHTRHGDIKYQVKQLLMSCPTFPTCAVWSLRVGESFDASPRAFNLAWRCAYRTTAGTNPKK
ncbi:hypothetical protein CALCODRAFT_236091 [Calocera cornea HHB12733]|uniref:Uncharacterized protein n=1 Tax=Calocera cornea HHB12733 TaxID=1353952 RepID=A0A165GV75_9BASI|nr:hypothetical protein CALCODRAFT_236091 [Calocera cornea HHB12733]